MRAGDNAGWKREMGMQLTVVEISPSMPAHEAAVLIQQHRVLVLVNLNGWTLHDRNDVFALQPSPVQVCCCPRSSFATSHSTPCISPSALLEAR
jgi:predicted O-linked N-acetylglucosamine transferase (SPINDLY family)